MSKRKCGSPPLQAVPRTQHRQSVSLFPHGYGERPNGPIGFYRFRGCPLCGGHRLTAQWSVYTSRPSSDRRSRRHPQMKAWMERLPMPCPSRSAIAPPLRHWGPAPERKPHPIAALPHPSDAEAPSPPQSAVGSVILDSRRLPAKSPSCYHTGRAFRISSPFVIIRTRRRTNQQTLHSLSRPDPINHPPTNRLPEPASHSCPRQRKTDQAKNTRQDLPHQTLPISALPG